MLSRYNYPGECQIIVQKARERGVFIFVGSSLSKRQREIIQQFADEVEGRASTMSHPTESGTLKEDKHGTDSFAPSTQPSPSRDWLSRTWHGLKGLMGY